MPDLFSRLPDTRGLIWVVARGVPTRFCPFSDPACSVCSSTSAAVLLCNEPWGEQKRLSLAATDLLLTRLLEAERGMVCSGGSPLRPALYQDGLRDVCCAQMLEEQVGLAWGWRAIRFEDLVGQLFKHDTLLFEEGPSVIWGLNRHYGSEDHQVLQAVE